MDYHNNNNNNNCLKLSWLLFNKCVEIRCALTLETSGVRAWLWIIWIWFAIATRVMNFDCICIHSNWSFSELVERRGEQFRDFCKVFSMQILWSWSGEETFILEDRRIYAYILYIFLFFKEFILFLWSCSFLTLEGVWRFIIIIFFVYYFIYLFCISEESCILFFFCIVFLYCFYCRLEDVDGSHGGKRRWVLWFFICKCMLWYDIVVQWLSKLVWRNLCKVNLIHQFSQLSDHM